MNDKPNGGPAFPTTDFTHAGQIIPGSEGMTLRDWFAGMAMQAACGYPKVDRDYIVRASYAMADAMLKERAK